MTEDKFAGVLLGPTLRADGLGAHKFACVLLGPTLPADGLGAQTVRRG